MKVALVFAGLLAALSACGGNGSAVQLRLTVTDAFGGKQTTKTYSLGCEPVSGTLPLRTTVCRHIAAHRQAMLAPRRGQMVCGGSSPVVKVEVKKGARHSTFSGIANCDWPGGTPLAIYADASRDDVSALRRDARRLRCEDNPAFFVQPTPLASIVACRRGLWTPAAERAIGAAKDALPGLQSLFPNDPGVVTCRIPAGGPAPGRTFAGRCGVSLSGPPAAKVVHFVEAWSQGRRSCRHRWTVRGSTVIAQDGPIVPQLWR